MPLSSNENRNTDSEPFVEKSRQFRARNHSIQMNKAPSKTAKQLGYQPVDNDHTITKLSEYQYVLHKLDNSKQK